MTTEIAGTTLINWKDTLNSGKLILEYPDTIYEVMKDFNPRELATENEIDSEIDFYEFLLGEEYVRELDALAFD